MGRGRLRPPFGLFDDDDRDGDPAINNAEDTAPTLSTLSPFSVPVCGFELIELDDFSLRSVELLRFFLDVFPDFGEVLGDVFGDDDDDDDDDDDVAISPW